MRECKGLAVGRPLFLQNLTQWFEHKRLGQAVPPHGPMLVAWELRSLRLTSRFPR
jgi:hypothetical protein